MARRKWRSGISGLVGSLVFVGAVAAEDFATDIEALTAIADASKSSAPHNLLNALNGKWETSYKWWLRPGQEPVEFKGKSVWQWVVDHRFIEEESEDQRLETSYKGKCFIGYDSGAKEYIMVRMDVLGDMLRTSRGQADASGSSITFLGTYAHPLSGETVKTRTVLTLDKKKLGFEFFETRGTAEELKAMEIQFKTRRQAGA